MAYQVVWSNTAESDFDEIIEYISNKQSPEKGIDFIQLVYRKIVSYMKVIHLLKQLSNVWDLTLSRMNITTNLFLFGYIENYPVQYLYIFALKIHLPNRLLEKLK